MQTTSAAPQQSSWIRLAVPSYSTLRPVLGAFILSRLLLLVVGIAARKLSGESSGATQLWVQWDANWYLDIIERGYSESHFFFEPGLAGQSNVAFFPAYPVLVRLLTTVMPSIPAGLLVSNACLLLACFFLHALVRERLGLRAGNLAVLSLCFFPGSFVFSGIMSEPLFILGTVGALLFAQRGAYGRAAAFGALTCATRATGIFLALALVMDWLWTRLRTPGKEVRWAELLVLGLAPLGLVAYMVFLDWRFGDAYAFQSVQLFWSRVGVHNPLEMLLGALRAPEVGTRLAGVEVLVLAGLLATYGRKFLSVGELLFVVLSLGVPLMSGMNSMPRFIVGLLPVHVLMGALMARREVLARELLLVLAMFNALMMAFWSRGSNVFV